MSVTLRGRMTLGGQRHSPNGTVWSIKFSWQASVRCQAVTGGALSRMTPGAQIY